MTGQEARDEARNALARVLAAVSRNARGFDILGAADALIAAGYRKHPAPEITDAAVEQRAKDMASASGWWWPTLGETGRLGRDGWRERARAELVRGGQA